MYMYSSSIGGKYGDACSSLCFKCHWTTLPLTHVHVMVSLEHPSPVICNGVTGAPPPPPPPQGVTAQQKEADVKALEARLKASELSVEVITSLTTPQLQPPMSASRTITKSSHRDGAVVQASPPPPFLLQDAESTSSEESKHSDSSGEAMGTSRPRSASHGR